MSQPPEQQRPGLRLAGVIVERKSIDCPITTGVEMYIIVRELRYQKKFGVDTQMKAGDYMLLL